MHIVADDREEPSGIVKLLENCGHNVTIKRLLIGDYMIDGKIVVERKTADDFVASIIHGRLFKQVSALKRLTLRIIMIIEGDPYRIKPGVHQDAVRGALLSIAVVWQVPVVFSSSRIMTVKQMKIMADQVARGGNVMPLRGGYLPRRLKNRQLFILQGLPGVGAKRAWRLLLHFKSVSGVFSASISELTEVDGVGSVVAGKIRAVLDADFKDRR